MPVRNGLLQDRILSDSVPVNLDESGMPPADMNLNTHVFEVFLLEDGKEEAGHGVVAIGNHGGC